VDADRRAWSGIVVFSYEAAGPSKLHMCSGSSLINRLQVFTRSG
jgi:hypothetical protein